jgi:AhpD family alkylhydroperoxidase
MAQHLIKHLSAPVLRRSTGSNRAVFAQMQLENAGVHGPFLIHAAQPELLAALWALFRETQLAGGLPRAEMETLALLIAQDNRCPWCIEAHEVALHVHGISPKIEQWYKANPDPLRATSSHPEDTKLRIASLCWQYINRMTNIFLVESAWVRFGTLRNHARPLLGQVFAGFFLRKQYPQGRSLGLIREVPLPDHLQWAHNAGASGQALAYFHHTLLGLGEKYLEPQTRQVVQHAIQAGQPLGLSRRWADQAVQSLPPKQQPIAKVLLFAALTSYQLDDALMKDFIDSFGGEDAAVLAAVAWGCYAPFLR